jgi:hypothetical protein
MLEQQQSHLLFASRQRDQQRSVSPLDGGRSGGVGEGGGMLSHFVHSINVCAILEKKLGDLEIHLLALVRIFILGSPNTTHSDLQQSLL